MTEFEQLVGKFLYFLRINFFVQRDDELIAKVRQEIQDLLKGEDLKSIESRFNALVRSKE